MTDRSDSTNDNKEEFSVLFKRIWESLPDYIKYGLPLPAGYVVARIIAKAIASGNSDRINELRKHDFWQTAMIGTAATLFPAKGKKNEEIFKRHKQDYADDILKPNVAYTGIGAALGGTAGGLLGREWDKHSETKDGKPKITKTIMMTLVGMLLGSMAGNRILYAKKVRDE